MTQSKIYLSVNARISLNEIIDYTKKQWTKKEFLYLKQRLNELLNIIQTNPYAFKTYHKQEHVRQAVLLANISVFYLVNNNEIHILILLFWDNRRNPEDLNL